MNKRASEEFLSPYNFVIWILLVLTIVAGITITGNANTDVRSAEAKVLAIRIADCLMEDGKIKMEFQQDMNLLDFCSLNAEIFAGGDYYAKISLIDLSTKEKVKEVTIGNADLEMQCEIKKQESQFAECYTQKIYLQDETSRDLILQVISASNNLGEVNL